MKEHRGGLPALALLTSLVALAPSGAAGDPQAGTPDGRALLEGVARRLFDVLEPAANWPDVEAGDAGPVRPGAVGCFVSRAPDGGVRAKVQVTPRLLEDLRGDADVLAFLVAREIGHVALGHLRDRP